MEDENFLFFDDCAGFLGILLGDVVDEQEWDEVESWEHGAEFQVGGHEDEENEREEEFEDPDAQEHVVDLVAVLEVVSVLARQVLQKLGHAPEVHEVEDKQEDEDVHQELPSLVLLSSIHDGSVVRTDPFLVVSLFLEVFVTDSQADSDLAHHCDYGDQGEEHSSGEHHLVVLP